MYIYDLQWSWDFLRIGDTEYESVKELINITPHIDILIVRVHGFTQTLNCSSKVNVRYY